MYMYWYILSEAAEGRLAGDGALAGGADVCRLQEVSFWGSLVLTDRHSPGVASNPSFGDLRGQV